MDSTPDQEPSTPVAEPAGTKNNENTSDSAVGSKADADLRSIAAWLELTPGTGAERIYNSHTDVLITEEAPSTGKHPKERRGSDDLPAQRSAASDDEAESPASTRRRRTLLDPVDIRPKHPLIPRDTTPTKDGTATTEHPSGPEISLSELAALVRQWKQQERRLSRSRIRSHGLAVAHHLSSRLVRCESSIRHGLLDASRSDDKQSFAILQQTFHGLRTSCETIRRQALLNPDIDIVDHRSLDEPSLCNPDSTFLHEIPSSTRDELLAFLSVLRSDPNFLTERLISLSAAELDAISIPHHTTTGAGTVFASPTSSVRKSNSGYSLRGGPGPGAPDRLLSFGRHDTFAILFSSLFAASPGSGLEDARRTEICSTLFARLISEPRPGGERLLHRILDAYAGLRGWRLIHNLELFLMGVLRDGHFLVDSPEDHFPRSRVTIAGFHDGFVSRGDGFLQTACRELFALFSQGQDSAGLPRGVLEVGSAAYSKINQNLHGASLQRLIVHRWFLGRYLPHAILNPEHHGLMRNYHITDSARASILRPLANEIQKHVSDGAYRWQPTPSMSSDARLAIDLMSSSIGTHQPSKTKLPLPSTCSTILLCPADIVTLVNGLFPERRPPSRAYEAHPPMLPAAWTSATFPVSESSAPVSVSSAFEDASSVFSMSASSMTSDTTSRGPINLDIRKPTSHTSLRTFSAADVHDSQLPDDEYGRRLRIACAEMAECLGPNAVSGTCHPSLEQWTVIRVSTDGMTLCLDTSSGATNKVNQNPKDPANIPLDIEDDTNDFFAGHEELELTITNLLADNEIIDSLNEGIDGTHTSTFVPGPSTSDAEHGGASDGLFGPTTVLGVTELATAESQSSEPLLQRGSPTTALAQLLKAAERLCHTRSRYLEAHSYHRSLQQLQGLERAFMNNKSIKSVDSIRDKANSALRRYDQAFRVLETQDKAVQQLSSRSDDALQTMCDGFEALRDKMWYTTDVRHSVPYEEARNLVSALKAMGLPWKASASKPAQPRLRHVRPSTNFELRQEGQALEIIAAPANMAGSNKLSDEQSELIASWLSDMQIQNLCKGEERIHRFCYEINRCADRLIGDGVLSAPVLWSSELFQNEKSVFERGYDKGDIVVTGLGHLARVGETTTWLQRSADRTSSPSIFSMASGGAYAPQSYGSSLNFSPSITTSSPSSLWGQGVHEAQRRLHHQSSNLDRPSSAASRLRSTRGGNKGYSKVDFLQSLRQRLLALLLSDFAPGLFNAGCETDAWLFGEIGSALMARRERQREGTTEKTSSGEQDHASAPKTRTNNLTDSVLPVRPQSTESFAYDDVFQKLLSRLSAMVDPFAKIDILHELQQMIIASLETEAKESDTDAIVGVFRRLFRETHKHQGTLFRDLQYIASFVPPSVIDQEPKGRAFWNAVLAALSLKEEVCFSMVEVADKVVARHTERRPAAQQPSEPDAALPATQTQVATQDSQPQSEADIRWAQRLATFSMADAAQMLVIAAKEGNPVAQRELAIFYLTHPEVLPRALAPLTAPKSVFKPELLAQGDRDKLRRSSLTPGRADPMTLCIAQHWMQCSKNGGDQLANRYLKARDEIERIP